MTKTLRALLVGLLLLGIIAVVGGDHDSSLWPLAGRFHPLLVHLPIGMLLHLSLVKANLLLQPRHRMPFAR